VVLRVEVDVDLAHRLELMHEIRRMEKCRARRAVPTTKTVRKQQRRGAILDDSGATLMSSSTSFTSLHHSGEQQAPTQGVELENKLAMDPPLPVKDEKSPGKLPRKSEQYFV